MSNYKKKDVVNTHAVSHQLNRERGMGSFLRCGNPRIKRSIGLILKPAEGLPLFGYLFDRDHKRPNHVSTLRWELR